MRLPWKFFVKGFFTLSALCVSFGVVRAEGDNCPPVIKRLGKDSRQQVESYIRAAILPNDSSKTFYIEESDLGDHIPGVIRRDSDYEIRAGLKAALDHNSSKLFSAAMVIFEEKFRLVTGLSGQFTNGEDLSSKINVFLFDVREERLNYSELLEFVDDGIEGIGMIQRVELAKEIFDNFINESSPTCLAFNVVDGGHIIRDSALIINSNMSDNAIVHCLAVGMFSSFGLYIPSFSPSEDISEEKFDKMFNEMITMLNLHYSSLIQEGYSRSEIENGLKSAMLNCN